VVCCQEQHVHYVRIIERRIVPQLHITASEQYNSEGSLISHVQDKRASTQRIATQYQANKTSCTRSAPKHSSYACTRHSTLEFEREGAHTPSRSHATHLAYLARRVHRNRDTEVCIKQAIYTILLSAGGIGYSVSTSAPL
jgi:hypothetical protein